MKYDIWSIGLHARVVRKSKRNERPAYIYI